MVFSSIVFAVWFLPIFLILYFVNILLFKDNKKRIFFCNSILLVASLIFYAWDTPIYILIMLFSIIINYLSGLLIEKSYGVWRKVELIASLAINLLILGYYKYYDFFVSAINDVFKCNLPILQVALPIGISFFTFQGISYVIDVYREEVNVQKNPFNMALYISMFPQLIAGPIVRYKTICEQIIERKIGIDNFISGSKRFIYGLAKKVLIANICAEVVDSIFVTDVFDILHMSCAVVWFGAICYTMQIYFDFSGYSDMAIGLGKVLGFDFMENFNLPYISKSITEFWRRWHISLSSFFRDYVYIPLGGSRTGNVYFNLGVVFVLTGLWHGASWNYILWGIWHGGFIIAERIINRVSDKKEKVIHGGVGSILRNLYLMIVVVVGWVIFRVENLELLLICLKTMFGINKTGWVKFHLSYYLNLRIVIVLAVAFLLSYNMQKYVVSIKEKIKDIYAVIIEDVFVILLFLLCIIVLTNSTYNPFIYFKF